MICLHFIYDCRRRSTIIRLIPALLPVLRSQYDHNRRCFSGRTFKASAAFEKKIRRLDRRCSQLRRVHDQRGRGRPFSGPLPPRRPACRPRGSRPAHRADQRSRDVGIALYNGLTVECFAPLLAVPVLNRPFPRICISGCAGLTTAHAYRRPRALPCRLPADFFFFVSFFSRHQRYFCAAWKTRISPFAVSQLRNRAGPCAYGGGASTLPGLVIRCGAHDMPWPPCSRTMFATALCPSESLRNGIPRC